MEPQTSERSFGVRQLLRAVNLRDFAQMVGGELSMLASSTRLALQTATRLPLGPLLAAGGLALVLVRVFLLVLVIVFFGGAIVLITLVRSASRLLGGHSTPGSSV